MAREKHGILFATKNPGKLAEFKETFNKFSTDYEIISFRDLAYNIIPDCDETGATFEENARLKVRNARRHLRGADKNLIVVGDDSGMRISYLNGEPGVYTRRWNGSEMTDEAIIAYCLDKMRGADNRSAEYVTYFAVSTPDDIAIISGDNRGVILERPRRSSLLPGLPFRTLFFVPELNLMFHEVRELSDEKRKGYILGHEQAIQQIVNYLDK